MARVDETGVAPVQLGKGPAQPIRIGRRQDDMDMVGHQAIGPDLRIRLAGRFAEQVTIQRVVRILEEGLAAPIAALRHVVRDTGELR